MRGNRVGLSARSLAASDGAKQKFAVIGPGFRSVADPATSGSSQKWVDTERCDWGMPGEDAGPDR